MGLTNWMKGLLIGVAGLLILALGIAGWVLLSENAAKSETALGEPTAIIAAATEVVDASPTMEQATLPPAIIVALPSDTPPPPTETPLPPTATAVPPTDEPTSIPPTNTAVFIPPTSTPIPPTATAVPPTAAPLGARGLIASKFILQDRSSYTVNGRIWFEFTVSNTTGGEVPYNAIGVMPKKDGTDRLNWYQQTYGGPNATLKTGGLSWEDNIQLPESGNYTLRLVVCFDGFDNCLNGGGTWHSLSNEIPITIN